MPGEVLTMGPNEEPVADYMTKRGYGNPRSKGWYSQNIVTVYAPNGAAFTVHKDAAPAFQGFINELYNSGYQIRPEESSGYNYRTKRGGTSLSQHAFGNAIDINSLTNPMTGKLVTDMPANIVELAAKWGLEWGGTWKGQKDAMHFEWTGVPVIPGVGAIAQDEAGIKALQQQLADAGLYKGEIDGVIGPQTRAALSAYSANPEVITATSNPDPLTPPAYITDAASRDAADLPPWAMSYAEPAVPASTSEIAFNTAKQALTEGLTQPNSTPVPISSPIPASVREQMKTATLPPPPRRYDPLSSAGTGTPVRSMAPEQPGYDVLSSANSGVPRFNPLASATTGIPRYDPLSSAVTGIPRYDPLSSAISGKPTLARQLGIDSIGRGIATPPPYDVLSSANPGTSSATRYDPLSSATSGKPSLARQLGIDSIGKRSPESWAEGYDAYTPAGSAYRGPPLTSSYPLTGNTGQAVRSIANYDPLSSANTGVAVRGAPAQPSFNPLASAAMPMSPFEPAEESSYDWAAGRDQYRPNMGMAVPSARVVGPPPPAAVAPPPPPGPKPFSPTSAGITVGPVPAGVSTDFIPPDPMGVAAAGWSDVVPGVSLREPQAGASAAYANPSRVTPVAPAIAPPPAPASASSRGSGSIFRQIAAGLFGGKNIFGGAPTFSATGSGITPGGVGYTTGNSNALGGSSALSWQGSGGNTITAYTPNESFGQPQTYYHSYS